MSTLTKFVSESSVDVCAKLLAQDPSLVRQYVWHTRKGSYAADERNTVYYAPGEDKYVYCEGENALYNACETTNAAKVEFLLQNGADPNQAGFMRSPIGDSIPRFTEGEPVVQNKKYPLEAAIFQYENSKNENTAKIIRLLLDNGADPNYKINPNLEFSALERIIYTKDKELILKMLEKGAQSPHALYAALSAQLWDVADLLLDTVPCETFGIFNRQDLPAEMQIVGIFNPAPEVWASIPKELLERIKNYGSR